MRRVITLGFYCLLLINFLYVLSGAIWLPIESVDVVGIWLFKTKAFFVEGGLPLQTLKNPDFLLFHPQYPLLLPAVYSLMYFGLGQVWELPLLLLYPLYYLAILLVALTVFRRMGLTELQSVFFTYIYSMFSPLLGQAGRGHAGSADIVLVLIAWVVVWLLQDANHQKRNGWLIVVMVAIASQIKLEGLFIGATLLVLDSSWPRKTTYLWFAALPTAVWMIVVKWLQIPSDFVFVLPSLSELGGRSWLILSNSLQEMLNLKNWYVFWPLFWLGLAIRPTEPNIFIQRLKIAGVLMACAFVAVYLSVTTDPEAHITSSIDRVFLQITPFVYPIFVFYATQITRIFRFMKLRKKMAVN